MQEGELVAENILRDLQGKTRKPFECINYGTMATIGRNKAIAEFGKWHYSGFVAWMMWLVVHIVLMVNFRNRLAVLSEWMWTYFTRERSARLITGDAEDLSSSTTVSLSK
jgi:NADH dehydrogenase